MTDRTPRIPRLPFMWNPFTFCLMLLFLLFGVLALQAWTPLDLGEAEWGIINLAVGYLGGNAVNTVKHYVRKEE